MTPVPDSHSKTELDREYIRALRDSAAELQKATSAFEHSSLKNVLLLNGGAAIAALAFFGDIADRGIALEFRVWSVVAMLIWSAGLIAATIATRFGYNSQLEFYKAANRKVTLHVATFLEGAQSEAAKTAQASFETKTREGMCHRTISHYASTCSGVAFALGVACAAVAFLYA